MKPRIGLPSRSFGEAFRAVANIVKLQDPFELRSLFDAAWKMSAVTYLEIGARRGGSFSVMAHALSPGALAIAVDKPGAGWGDEHSARYLTEVIRDLRVEGIEARAVIGDSHTAATFKTVKSLLGERMVDVLFIDGDHSRNGVILDFQDYASFVRSGGLIAFHDIYAPPPIEVAEVWQRISHIHKVDEFKQTGGRDLGIGIVKVPEEYGLWGTASRRRHGF